MGNLKPVEIKAFVPARDYELSKQFYQDMGFTMASESPELAYFHFENTSFLLQNFYVKEHADNFMMHLLVEDADAWWEKLRDAKIAEKYSIKIGKPQDQPWRMRDFTLTDPSGVLWRIAHNI